MHTTVSQVAMLEMAAELGGAPGYTTAIKYGPLTMVLESAARVSCTTTYDTRCTMAQIISECMRQGIACTEPQALAAAYSVPDGMPISMAVDNVGPLPSDAVVAHFTRERSALHGALGRMLRG